MSNASAKFLEKCGKKAPYNFPFSEKEKKKYLLNCIVYSYKFSESAQIITLFTAD